MGRYLTKNLLFDILSLADQLYRSKSTELEDSKQKKIYFSKNLILDFMFDRIKILLTQVEAFNISLKRNKLIEIRDNINKNITRAKSYLIKVSDNETNKAVNDLFFSICKLTFMTSNLVEMFL